MAFARSLRAHRKCKMWQLFSGHCCKEKLQHIQATCWRLSCSRAEKCHSYQLSVTAFIAEMYFDVLLGVSISNLRCDRAMHLMCYEALLRMKVFLSSFMRECLSASEHFSHHRIKKYFPVFCFLFWCHRTDIMRTRKVCMSRWLRAIRGLSILSDTAFGPWFLPRCM